MNTETEQSTSPNELEIQGFDETLEKPAPTKESVQDTQGAETTSIHCPPTRESIDVIIHSCPTRRSFEEESFTTQSVVTGLSLRHPIKSLRKAAAQARSGEIITKSIQVYTQERTPKDTVSSDNIGKNYTLKDLVRPLLKIPLLPLLVPYKAAKESLRAVLFAAEVITGKVSFKKYISERYRLFTELSRNDLAEIEENLSQGRYRDQLKRTALDIFVGGGILWPVSWVGIGWLCINIPQIGIPLAAYEAIPGLGGLTSIGQMAWLFFIRALPFSLQKLKEGNLQAAQRSLLSPLTAFGDINWIIGSIIVNNLQEPKMLKLLVWSSWREVKNFFSKSSKVYDTDSFPKSEPKTQDLRVEEGTRQFIEQQKKSFTVGAVQAPTITEPQEAEPFFQGSQVFIFEYPSGERIMLPYGNAQDQTLFPWINGTYKAFRDSTALVCGLTPGITQNPVAMHTMINQLKARGYVQLTYDAPSDQGPDIARNLQKMGLKSKLMETQGYIAITTSRRELFDTSMEFQPRIPPNVDPQAVLKMYQRSFKPTVAGSPCLQAYDDYELLEVLEDESVYKLVLAEGENVVGFMAATQNLDTIPWINRPLLLSRIEQMGYTPRTLTYIPCVAILTPKGIRDAKRLVRFRDMIRAVFNFAITNKADIAIYDRSENVNARLDTTVPYALKRRVTLKTVGEQQYYIASLV